MNGEILKKITIKDVMGTDFDARAYLIKLAGVDANGDPKDVSKVAAQDLMVVIGTTSEIISDSSQYGDFYVFQGAFEATRLSDGVIFKSPKCILPEPLNGILGGELYAIVRPEDMKDEEVGEGNNKRKRKRGKVPAAQFGVIIGVKPSKKGARGYEWTSKPVVVPSAVDTLADLRATTQAALKALPKPEAPKGDVAKDEKKAEEVKAKK